MFNRVFKIILFLVFSSVIYGQSVDSLYELTRNLEAQNRFDESYRVALKIINLEDTYDSWLRCGWLAWQAGKINEAAKAYEGALLHVPTSVDAQLGLLATLDRRKKWASSENLARKILLSTPGQVAARRYLAHALFRQKRYKEASAHYHKLVRHSPDDKDMAYGLGLCLWELGQETTARHWLKKAGRPVRDRGKARAVLAKAHIFFFNGNYSKQSFYGDFSGQQVVVEGGAGGRLGFVAHYSKSDTPNATQGNLNKKRQGVGLVYNLDDKRYLLRFTSLNATEDYVGEGNVISLYAGEGDCGLAIDLGNYDDFSTIQLTFDFLCKIDEKTKLIVSPMVQRRSGELVDTRGYDKNLESIGFSLKRKSLWFGGYFGNRWFPVTGSGLIVWNADEEFQYGLEAGIGLGKGNIKPTLSVRYDKLESQLGVASNASSLTYSAGCTFNF